MRRWIVVGLDKGVHGVRGVREVNGVHGVHGVHGADAITAVQMHGVHALTKTNQPHAALAILVASEFVAGCAVWAAAGKSFAPNQPIFPCETNVDYVRFLCENICADDVSEERLWDIHSIQDANMLGCACGECAASSNTSWSVKAVVAISSRGAYLGHVYAWVSGDEMLAIGVRKSLGSLHERGVGKFLFKSVVQYALELGISKFRLADSPIGPVVHIMQSFGMDSARRVDMGRVLGF